MYREAHVMLCPRCGDMLERMLEIVHSCARCEGIWLDRRAVQKAFGNPQFPLGPSVWWRRELSCPICSTVMAAIEVEGLLVDRCAQHGLWLDHGELGRLLGAPTVIELDELHRLLAPNAPPPQALVDRRAARKADVARRQRELDEYRAKVLDEQRRLEQERAALQRRVAAEEVAEQKKRLGELRDVARGEVATAERRLAVLREQVRAGETKLQAACDRLLEIERAIDKLG